MASHDASGDFAAWLAGRLEALDLDPDVYVEYVGGIMSDTDQNLEERGSAVTELLSGALDGSDKALGAPEYCRVACVVRVVMAV